MSKGPSTLPPPVNESALLDPQLAALKQRLQQGIANDTLTLNATSLGVAGQRIVDLMVQWLLTNTLTVTGNVTVGSTAETVTLAADQIVNTIAGVTTTATKAVFGINALGLTAQIRIDCGSGWTPLDSFPDLTNTWAGTFVFVTDQDDDAQFVFATDAGPLIGDAVQQVVLGLNLRGKLDLSNGPAAALAILITGLTGPLPVIGPARDDASWQSLSVTGPLPDFSVTLPILPALNFRSPFAGVAAILGPGFSQQTYTAYIQAGAAVAVGTQSPVSIPLVVRVPTQSCGWMLSIPPGQSVPISNLLSFLGDFTGLGFVSKLPSQITALQKLELQSFAIQLTPERADFYSLSFALGSIPGQEGENLWTVIPGTAGKALLALSGIRFRMDVLKTGGDYSYSGMIEGTFDLSQTLKLTAMVPIPANEGPWTVSCSSYTALPNLLDIAQYLGGQQLSDLLPRRLGQLTSYQLNNLTFVYDPQQNSFTRLELAISTAAKWVIVENWIEITEVLAQVSLERPSSGNNQITGNISGKIVLAEALELAITVYRGAAADPWRLNVFTEEVPLPSLGTIARLCGGDLSPVLPQTILTNTFSIRNLALNVNITGGSVEKFSFELSTTDTWTIITGILLVKRAGIFLNLDWTSGTRQATGSIWGDISFCDASFWVEARKNIAGWNLAARLEEGSQLTLQNLVGAFNPTLWSGLQALGVPAVALKAAEIDYETETGSYSFSGEIGPADNSKWTINLGVANISIKSIGAEVTCHRGQGGLPDDKKVYVTGSFAIGSATFTTKYLAGQNLSIDCALVGSVPVTVSQLVQQLCGTDATQVTWAAGFPALNQISLANVAASIILGSDPEFQLTGTLLLEGVEVNALFLVKKIQNQWQFALGIRVQTSWTLNGFTSAFAAFNLNHATWVVVGSSFPDLNFQFPPSFPTPGIAAISRGLNFYGTFALNNTLPTFQAITTVLPSGTITTPTLTVHGLLADPLANSFLEVFLVADAAGVPLMGWDAVRLAQFSLRLTAAPSFALHGDFILKSINNPDGSFLHIILNLSVSATGVQIAFEQQPGQGAIFTWVNAFGLPSLTISLLDLALGIIFEGPALDGTIGGRVTFEHQDNPTNSVMKNALPYPHVVAIMEAKRHLRALSQPERYGPGVELDYRRRFDQDGILVVLHTSFIIPAEEPIPVPYKLAGRFINFTLPYILKRFVDIDVPPLLMPIQFPDVEFDFALPNPLHSGGSQILKFSFRGDIVIYGLVGHIDARFDQSRIRFTASMNPLLFQVNGFTIVRITKSNTDLQHGPDVSIDSKPDPGQPQIGGHFYCVFFNNFIDFGGAVEVQLNAQNPANSRFYFEFQGHVGSLANLHLKLLYQEHNYLSVDGTFNLAVTTNNIPGFSKNGTEVAERIDLSKCNAGLGVALAASLHILLDGTNPVAPVYSMAVAGSFGINLGSGCNFELQLRFALGVTKDSMSQIPGAVVTQLMTNTAQIFGALIQSAACYFQLLKLGLLILEDALKVAKVFADVFVTGIEVGADFLMQLGNGADTVANALWNIFNSHNSESNTKAMKDAGYSSEDTGSAVKQASDAGGHPYQAQDLVRDQAAARYSAPQVADALCVAFTDYQNRPIDAGRLLANSQLTSFQPVQVAAALRSQYSSSTGSAAQMYTVLAQVYQGAAALGPQAMANALAPLYPAPQVAQVLRNHYPNDTQTASAMAVYLVTAYVSAAAPLDAPGLGASLAPLYNAIGVAPVLRADFPSATDTAPKLGTVLKNAYATTPTPLTAPKMAAALFTVFTTPSTLVAALQQLYPTDTDTAMKMAGLLKGASPAIDVGQMAAALVAGGYPKQDVAAALKFCYPATAGTPLGMTRVLAAASYAVVQVAPILKALFPTECGTATAVLGFLQQGFLPATISAANMMAALAQAPFTAVQSAPAVKSAYPTDTQTATAMATLLAAAYTGPLAINASTMSQALAASPYSAATNSGTAKALLALYPSDTQHALNMSQLLKLAPYSCANIGPALQEFYSAETQHAANLASVFAATPFDAPVAAPVLKTSYASELPAPEPMYTVLRGAYSNATVQVMAASLAASPYAAADVAPVLKVHYPADTSTASAMYGLLVGAYQPALDAQTMATALARSPYPASQTASVLKTNFGASASTPSQLVTLLKNAYTQPPIGLTDMLRALSAIQFNAYEMAPAVKPVFTPTGHDMGLDLVNAMISAPPSATQLGSALMAATYGAAETAQGVQAGQPATSAGLMAAILLTMAETTMLPALAAAKARKTAGDSVVVAAPKVVQAVAGVTGAVLVSALDGVFTPPNLDLQTLAGALPGSFAQPDASSIAQGLLTSFPATPASTLVTTLTTAFQSAGKTLSASAAAIAVANAFQFIGSPLSQPNFATMLVQAMGSAATPNAVAAALVNAFNTAATAATIVPSLVAGFSGTTTLVDARVTAIALQQALGLTSNQADVVARPLGQNFNLTRNPNDVGVFAIALMASGFTLNSSSAALAAYFGLQWNARGFAVVGSVYSQPAWSTGIAQRTAGSAITVAAPAVYAANAPNAALMVQVLAGTYDLNQTAAAIAPMANALKSVVAGGEKVYTVNEASAAMQAQYAPDWNAQNWQQFISIFIS
jgi:hypothetical protein